MKNRFLTLSTCLAIGFFAFAFLAQSAGAQDYSHIRIVRLSFVEGDVQFLQPGESWQDAGLNLPIQEGFALRTANGYAEVEFENGLSMRVGPDSKVEFPVLALVNGGHLTHLEISQGTAIIGAKISRADVLSVTASGVEVKVPRSGSFRVDAAPSESWVTVFKGKLEVDSALGTKSLIGSGHTLHEQSDGSSAPEIAGNPPADAFDKWVAQRESAVNYGQNGTADVLSSRNYTEGFADLYDSGLWSYIPGYGPGWMPYGVAANWMPFASGQWMFMGDTGWNWVSNEPWGWLPYHFGGWVNAPGVGWAWIPQGAGTWQPSTATWVQVNNHLGWVPTPPVQTSKATNSLVSPTAVLAAQGPAGVITAGNHMSVAGSTLVRMGSAPAPGLQITNPGANFANGSVGRSVPVPESRASAAHAFHNANGIAAPQSRFARNGSIPPSLLAPHSAAAPGTIARGSGAFRGGFGGMHGNPGGSNMGGRRAGMGSTPAARAASHSGSSAGSSGGHR